MFPRNLRHLRRLVTHAQPTPFQIRLENAPRLPELPDIPSKTLIRETTNTLCSHLKKRGAPVVLHGPSGVGKSTLLAQAVAHARKAGHVVIYIPDAREWTAGGSFFAPAAVDGMEPHLHGLPAVRFYDRPAQTAALFKHLLAAHADDLAEMTTHASLATPLTEACGTLRELVELGDRLLDDIDSNWRLHPEHAGDVLAQLLDELAAADRPAALVIDDFPYFTGMTCMTNERRERLHANSIRAIAQHLGRDAIERFAATFPGPVLLSADENHPFEHWRKSRVRAGVQYPLSEDVKRDASGRVWWRDFLSRVDDAGSLLNVPPLASSELRAVCATFGAGRDRPSNRLVALAGGRADRMRRIYATR